MDSFNSAKTSFLATYHRHQPWSIPDSVIYYITKNPSTPKAYEKMVQCCKYFFIKNPILIISSFKHIFRQNKWNTFFNDEPVELNAVKSKIWINDTIDCNSLIEQKYLPAVNHKIYQSSIKKLKFQRLIISLDDFIFFASKCEEISLSYVAVIDDDDSIVTLEKIVKIVPYVKKFFYSFDDTYHSTVTSNTVQELLKIPHFLNLDFLSLAAIPEAFNVDYDFLKRNKKTKMRLSFSNQISQEYKNQLQNVINEILATENHDYQIPYIYFYGMNPNSFMNLRKLHFDI